MSWIVGGLGITPAINVIIERQFVEGQTCPQPEESIRQAARKIIAETLQAQDDGVKVNVNGYGSQGLFGDKTTVSLGITITVEL